MSGSAQRLGVATDIGKRSSNQDAHFLQDLVLTRGEADPLAVLAVADGMGGHAEGATAAHIAIEHVEQLLASSRDSNALVALVRAANERIRTYGETISETVGTTLTLAVVEPGLARIAHVGDSRAYLVHASQIAQVTEDHTLVGDLVRRGAITPQEALQRTDGNVLQRAVGPKSDVEVDIYDVGVGPGDALVLCSDGLVSTVSPEEILYQVEACDSMQEAATRLVTTAVARGADDNVTVAIWAYPGATGESGRTLVATRRGRRPKERVSTLARVVLVGGSGLLSFAAGWWLGAQL